MKHSNATLWKFEVLTQKIDKLSTAFVVEAARAGEAGRGLAVVAEELRLMGDEMYTLLEHWKFDQGNVMEDDLTSRIVDMAERTELLTINAMLVSLSQPQFKGTLICSEEIRWIAVQMRSLLYHEDDAHLLESHVPILSSVSTISNSFYYFLSYRLGGIEFLENTQFIREILHYPGIKAQISKNTFRLRGQTIHMLDGYRILGVPEPKSPDHQRMMILHIPNRPSLPFGVIIDGVAVNAIFKSRLGQAVKPENVPINSEFLRECWKTEEERQLMFLDWEKLSTMQA